MELKNRAGTISLTLYLSTQCPNCPAVMRQIAPLPLVNPGIQVTVIDEKMVEPGARITEQLVKHGAQAAEKLHQAGLEVTRGIQETSDRTAA